MSIIAPERSQEIVDFLRDVFGFRGTPDHFTATAVAWKYFAPHPWWPEGRSYALEVNDRLAAHACVAPVRFGTPEAAIDSLRIIDWAAARTAPGAGLLILRHCMTLARGPLIMVGGSNDTRQFVNQLRVFKKKADMHTYARPLRPFARFARSSHGVRDWAKLARNAYWHVRPPLPLNGDWICRPAVAHDPVFTPAGGDFMPVLRTREWLDYLLACPVGATELLILERQGVPLGHAVVCHISGSARVADFALAGHPSLPDRIHAFAALVDYVTQQGRGVELVAASSIAEHCLAFESCGMRLRNSRPVAAADPMGALGPDTPLEVNLMLGDAFYLHDSEHPFLT